MTASGDFEQVDGADADRVRSEVVDAALMDVSSNDAGAMAEAQPRHECRAEDQRKQR